MTLKLSSLCRTTVLLLLSVAFAVPAAALTRVPNTTISIPLEPQSGSYTTENAFGNLTFLRPVAMVAPPDETNRLFVVEQPGYISVISDLTAPSRTVFLDLTDRVSPSSPFNEHGLLGLAFHPEYASNGYLYVFYTGHMTGPEGYGLYDILSRFETQPSNPNAGLPSSEVRMILQKDPAANHNGGALEFGPDGYLYVSLGDGGGGNDQYNNSQKIDAGLFAGMLRIDVDKRPGSLTPNNHPAATTNYAIPPDNPFIGATSFNGSAVIPGDVRTEYWAVGLRNPWRMSFDQVTGTLYVGDVGQSAWEEVNIIEPGGNYGWAYREGLVPGPKSNAAPAGFTGDLPLLSYPPMGGNYGGRAVIGGYVYRGSRLSELYGAYIFGDFGISYGAPNGSKIWLLRHEGTNVTEWTYLATTTQLTGFGVDPGNGDILLAQVSDGRIKRLVRSSISGSPPPSYLSETGVFSDLSTLTPEAGVVPYEINTPFWSDNAIKSRWFSVPDTNQVIDFSIDENWSFPVGTVWIKHMELELTNAVPSSRHRLETRLMVKNDDGVHGFTYRWGGAAAEAQLVDEAGMDETFYIYDGGVITTQVWRYPSRSECLACHTESGGFGTGFNTGQLNLDSDMGEGLENQVGALSDAGYFSSAVSNRHLLPALTDLSDPSVSLEHRVRSYLFANCYSCHTPGQVPAHWDSTFATLTAQAGLIDGKLVNSGGNPSNRFVARGSLDLSMALERISKRGPGQMPPIGSNLIDTQAVALLSAWITNALPSYRTFTEWQVDHFGSTNAPGAGADEDFDEDGDDAYLEFLNGTDPKLASSKWRIDAQHAGTHFHVTFPRTAERGYELQYKEHLSNPAWVPLNTPSNAPAYLSSNTVWAVPGNAGAPADSRFYRVRVFER